MDLRSAIREVPDFPKEGILFFDVSTLFQNAEALAQACREIAERFRDSGVGLVAGIESRGFVVGGIVAQLMGVGFTMLRKPGKLPYDTLKEEYKLEYGTDAIEMHVDGAAKGQKVLVVDDLLATGGTARAARRLIERAGAQVVACAFIVELDFLPGRKALEGVEVFSLVHYDSEAIG